MEALDRVVENAKRLLADAEAMFELERWQTGTALAILALEEVGKYYLISWEHDEGKKVVSHKTKQAVLASFYLADSAIDATKKFLMTEVSRFRV